MDEKIFNSLSTYGKIYYFLADGNKSKDDVLKYLIDAGMRNTTATDHAKKAVEGGLPYISYVDGVLVLDKAGIETFITELAERFFYEISIEPKRKKRRKAEDEYGPVMSGHSPGYQEMIVKVNSTIATEKNLKKRIREKNAEIAELKAALANRIDDVVLRDMKSKVLVIGSAKVKPEKTFQRDFFLDDPVRLLDVNDLVSRYGGEIPSLYEPMFSIDKESEKELTTENYLRRIGKMLFKGKLFKSRLEEQERLPVVNAVEQVDESWVKRDSINLVEIEKNRLESVNTLLATDGISNQMKLALYAAWFDGVDPEMVELLNYAGDLDVNAEYVIRLLEKPKEYRNYRTIRGLLKQAKKASEAHIKREAAIELISGEWYVEADYRGKPCKFQMMPVDEMQVFLDLLKTHRTDEAITALEKLLAVKRKASAGGDIIKVTDESDEKALIEPPQFLQDLEKDRGVNCHPKLNDDEAYEDFSELEQEVKDGEK